MSMGKSPRLTDAQISGFLRALIEDGKVAEELYGLLCAQGFIILDKRLFGIGGKNITEEAHSLALDFLLYVRTKRLSHLQTAAHLIRELSKYLTRRESPAYHKVWKILSQALLYLEEDRLALRLSRHGANSQSAEWCLKVNEGGPPVNLQAFSRAAAELPVYHPSRKDGRLLSPAQAKELALRMLELAGGPILMQDLHSEAMKHVILAMAFPQSFNAEADDCDESVSLQLADRMPVLGYILEEEAVARAMSLWDELENTGDQKVLCTYYLPKHLLGRSITGSELGGRSRISEASKRIKTAFHSAIDLTSTLQDRQEAARMAQRDPADGDVSVPQLQLLGRMAEILIQFCSEKSWDFNLKQKIEEQ